MNCDIWQRRAWPRRRRGRPCRRPPWCMRRGYGWWAKATTAGKIARIFSARHKARIKHGGGQIRLDINDLELSGSTPDEKVLLINEALEQLQKEDPEKARIVVMKFFGGMTNQEVAENLGVTERTIERQWAYAKAWMF